MPPCKRCGENWENCECGDSYEPMTKEDIQAQENPENV
jgi:hypothetical protein